MKKYILLCICAVAALTGCVGPRYTGSSIENIETVDVVILHDASTRAGFQEAMESWLKGHGYQYTVAPAGSKYDLDKINLEYFGKWQWDLAIYLSEASITAYTKGQKIGYVQFRAPNSLSPNKFGNAEERIRYIMDVLFKKLTIDEANKLINQ